MHKKGELIESTFLEFFFNEKYFQATEKWNLKYMLFIKVLSQGFFSIYYTSTSVKRNCMQSPFELHIFERI